MDGLLEKAVLTDERRREYDYFAKNLVVLGSVLYFIGAVLWWSNHSTKYVSAIYVFSSLCYLAAAVLAIYTH